MVIFRAPYSDLYIVCADIVESLEKLLEQPVKILTVFDSKRLDGLFYRSVHQNGLALPFLQSESVTNKQGTTGLVHTSFTHGFDDYKVN
jgi:isoleucyl-tRNA synthetase